MKQIILISLLALITQITFASPNKTHTWLVEYNGQHFKTTSQLDENESLKQTAKSCFKFFRKPGMSHDESLDIIDRCANPKKVSQLTKI